MKRRNFLKALFGTLAALPVLVKASIPYGYSWQYDGTERWRHLKPQARLVLSDNSPLFTKAILDEKAYNKLIDDNFEVIGEGEPYMRFDGKQWHKSQLLKIKPRI